MSTLCSCDIRIRRAWAMPSANTFTIKPIAALLDRWLDGRACIVDPFARNSKRATITNDLSLDTLARFNLEARDFLRQLHCDHHIVADAALLDPPYSPRQIKECYESVGMPVGQCETQHAKLISDVKNLLSPLITPGGIVITCGWNSQGMGKWRNFELREMLVVAHGGSHNDTKAPHADAVACSPLIGGGRSSGVQDITTDARIRISYQRTKIGMTLKGEPSHDGDPARRPIGRRARRCAGGCDGISRFILDGVMRL